MIKKTFLFILAGALWVFAGTMVASVGIKALQSDFKPLAVILAMVIFAIFFTFIFSKMVNKNERRIMGNTEARMPFYKFVDNKTYIIIAFMMSLGIVLRKSGLLPIFFFEFFYTGLGLALIVGGIKSLILFFKHNYLKKSN